jgi:hypothetical protein
MGHPLFLLGALGGFTGVYVHGALGYRAVIAPLRERAFPTGAFGDAEMTWRVWRVGWHLITLFFGGSGLAFLLLWLGRLDGTALPRVLGSLYGGFALLAFALLGGRLPAALRRPIPILFTSVMTAVTLAGWLG